VISGFPAALREMLFKTQRREGAKKRAALHFVGIGIGIGIEQFHSSAQPFSAVPLFSIENGTSSD
jgi:hypothetical protein